MRHPPRFTLFPYTTLFRSKVSGSCAKGVAQCKGLSMNESRGRRGFVDRKSTRLNSSHLGISYAVFCLKKKNKKKTRVYKSSKTPEENSTLSTNRHPDDDNT